MAETIVSVGSFVDKKEIGW